MEKYIPKINNILSLITKEYYSEVKKELQELKNSMTYDIAAKNCKGNKKHQLKNAKLFLKDSIKKNKYRPLLHKIYKIDDTYQLCDGYIGIVLKNMIEGLEINQENADYFDCRKIINNCNPTSYNYEKIEFNIIDLEQAVLNLKKMDEISIDSLKHIKNSYFNPIYLLRAIRILGTENVELFVHNSSNSEPAYLKSELGEAIVLPIRVQNNKEN